LVIVIGGLCLLILPGIIWAIKYGYYGYFIIEHKAGALNALKLSSDLTRGSMRDLFVFALFVCGLNVLGALCLGAGLLISLPLTQLAEGFIYRKLLPHLPETAPAGDASGG
jgi:uncharacterized membrane protein